MPAAPFSPAEPQVDRSFYVTGGTLSPDAASYVARRADRDLLQGLLSGQYCYVLNTRQMGKSSLSVRTIARLQEQGVRTVFLDLTKIGGQNSTADQWYAGLMSEIGRALGLRAEFIAYAREHREETQVLRLFGALREVAFGRFSGPIVIFVDEIDAVRSLPFPADEFFAAIRECYTARATRPEMGRLTFCLLGVATPADLISDTRMSPFNIGQRIRLEDFTPQEALPLAAGLGANGAALLARVLYWTGGHPYLTQRLCRAVAERTTESVAGVDQLCDALFLSRSARDSDDNLAFVRSRLLHSEADLASLLDLYQKVRSGKRVRDDETNPLCATLRLSGVCRTEGDYLKVRNRIYHRVFDRDWVLAHMPNAELRRQRAAYRRGVARTGALAAVVLALMTGLAGTAMQQAKRAAAGEKAARLATLEARAEKARAIAGERAARDASRVARDEKLRAERLASARQSALLETARQRDRARAAQHRADENARAAREASQGEARQRARAVAEAAGSWRNFYVAQVNRAQNAVDAGEYLNARNLLEELRPRPGREDLREFAWRYLYDQVRDRSRATIPIPWQQQPRSVLAPDGSTLATAGDGNSIRLWNIKTMQPLATLKGHPGLVFGLAFSPDGRLLASGDGNGSVRLWDVVRERLIRAFPRVGGQVRSVTFSPDGKTLAAGSGDGFARLWDVTTGRPVSVLRPGQGTRSIAFFPEGNRLAVSRGADIQIWDVAAPRVLQTLEGGGFCMAVSPDGRWLAAAHNEPDQPPNDANVRLWNLVDTKPTFRDLKPYIEHLLDVEFSPDSKTLASASFQGIVRLWDVASGTQKRVIRGHRGSVEYVTFSRDGKRLVTTSKDGTVKVWDAAEPEERRLLSLPDDAGYYRLSAPAKKLVVASGETLHVRDLGSGRLITLHAPGRALLPLGFSRDGRELAAVSETSAFTLRRLASGQQTQPLQLPPKWQQYSLSSDLRIAAVVMEGNSVHLWEIATGRRIGVVQLPEAPEQAVVSPDGRWLVTRVFEPKSRHWIIRLWNVPSRRGDVLYSGVDDVVPYGFSDDSGRLLTITRGVRTYTLWNTADRTARGGGTLPETSAKFAVTPEMDTLASLNSDRTVTVYAADTGRQIARLKVSGDRDGVLVGRGGRIVYTVGRDGGTGRAIWVWSVGSERERRLIRGSDSLVLSDFTPDGESVVTFDGDPKTHRPSVTITRVATGKRRVLVTGESARRFVGLAGAGDQALFYGRSSVIRTWEALTSRPIGALPLPSTVSGSQLSGDLKTLVGYGEDRALGFWDLASGRQVRRLKLDERPRWWGLSPDAKTVLTSEWDEKGKRELLRLHDLVTGRVGTIYAGPGLNAGLIRFSPDSKTLVGTVGIANSPIFFWDVARRRLRGRLPGHKDWVHTMAFAPSGKLMATGSGDRTIKLWDVTIPREITTLRGHSSTVTYVAFSADGRVLASAGADKTVKLWNLTARQDVATFKVEQIPNWLDFSADGRLLMMTDNRGGKNSLHLWRAPALADSDAAPAASAPRTALRRHARHLRPIVTR